MTLAGTFTVEYGIARIYRQHAVPAIFFGSENSVKAFKKDSF